MVRIFMLLLLLVGLFAVLPNIWRRVVDGNVHISIQFHLESANIGEAVPVDITIVNNSWLPCPMVHGILKLSKGLSTGQSRGKYLAFTVFLWMKQQVTMTRIVYGLRRGPQQIVSVSVEMNEGLGIQPFFFTESLNVPLFILPNLIKSNDIRNATKEITGNIEIERWLYPDESLFKGVRPYQNRDPLKHIDWKATAKVGNLMTKQFNGATEGRIVLVLNAQFTEPFWAGTSFDKFDDLCSVVATYAFFAERNRIQLSLFANSTFPMHPKKQWYGIQSAAGMRRTLSRMLPYANSPFERLLETVQRATKPSDKIIVVTDFLTSKQKQALLRLQSDGRCLLLVQQGKLDGEPLWNNL